MNNKLKISVAITGASGAIYAKVLLDKLSMLMDQISTVDLVFSSNAKDVWQVELNDDSYNGYDFNVWENNNYYSPIASGSAGYDSLIICPCSMGTLGRIASGVSNDLITRAADVMLKERKKLIVVPRESPYNLIHLRNMTSLTEAGATIIPASPSFYSKPKNIYQLAETVVDRILLHAGLQIDTYKWGN